MIGKLDMFHLNGYLKNPILKIGIDIDNTILDNDFVWRHHMMNEPCIGKTPHRKILPNEESIHYDYFNKICTDCFTSMLNDERVLLNYRPKKHALETLRTFHKKNIEFHLITARPKEIVRPTIAWLRNHELLNSIATLTFSEKKRPICESLGLGFHVDDSYEVYEEMMTPMPSTTKILFIDSSHNKNNKTSNRFYNWTEISKEFSHLLETKIESL